MSTAREVVAAFIAAIEAKDVDSAMALVSDDLSYENMPMDPIVGKDATRAVLEAFLGPATGVVWEVLRECVVGNTVVNERIDRFDLPGGTIELAVAGFFEVDEAGLITLWRDYFDMASYTRQLAAATAT